MTSRDSFNFVISLLAVAAGTLFIGWATGEETISFDAMFVVSAMATILSAIREERVER